MEIPGHGCIENDILTMRMVRLKICAVRDGCMRRNGRTIGCVSAARLVLCTALAAALLCGCTKGGETASTGADDSGQRGTQSASTEAEPVTLEQELLKRRGIAFDQSDYKKFIGGEGIIDEYAEFDCNVDHGYSQTINDLVVSGGKLYQANLNTALANGQNIQELGTLPGKDVQYWHLTYDGEMGSLYLKDGSGYKVSGIPFSTTPLDKAQYPLFKKVYHYAADGKSLEDHTAEYQNADKVYDSGTPMIVFAGGKVSLLFSGKYLDKGTSGWNWYRDMGWREYIAFDLDVSAIGSETPVRLFNQNILMTNCAFYEIVYASEPLDDKKEETQLASDGSVSPYYPAAQHLNCNLKLRKLELLTTYYANVRNISTSYVITEDYTLLPIAEVITEGYNKYQNYNCNRFYWNYITQ